MSRSRRGRRDGPGGAGWAWQLQIFEWSRAARGNAAAKIDTGSRKERATAAGAACWGGRPWHHRAVTQGCCACSRVASVHGEGRGCEHVGGAAPHQAQPLSCPGLCRGARQSLIRCLVSPRSREGLLPGQGLAQVLPEVRALQQDPDTGRARRGKRCRGVGAKPGVLPSSCSPRALPLACSQRPRGPGLAVPPCGLARGAGTCRSWRQEWRKGSSRPKGEPLAFPAQLLMELKKPRIHLKCKYLEKLKQQGLCRHARGELMGSPGLTSAPGTGKSPGTSLGKVPHGVPSEDLGARRQGLSPQSNCVSLVWLPAVPRISHGACHAEVSPAP